MQSIDTLKRKADTAKAVLIAKRTKIDDLEKHAAAVNNQADEAARAGDLEKYKALDAEARDLKSRIYVEKRSLEDAETHPAVPRDEVKKAWADYVQGYQKALEKALETYRKQRAALYEAYSALTAMQTAAMRQRNICGELAGMPVNTINDQNAIANTFSMPYIPDEGNSITTYAGGGVPDGFLSYGKTLMSHPDPMFFKACGLMSRQEYDDLTQILHFHHFG